MASRREAFDKQRLAVKLIAAYCLISYVLVVVLCLTFWCQPIYEYWRVPVLYCTGWSLSPKAPSALTCFSSMCYLLQPYDLRHVLQRLVRSHAPPNPTSHHY
jgi:hypothetical protein